jgi:hypothetical protein
MNICKSQVKNTFRMKGRPSIGYRMSYWCLAYFTFDIVAFDYCIQSTLYTC